jgi:MSHA biogenesis protein MshN
MSLINQVLNDLEKRGVARETTGDDTIRVNPVQAESKLLVYVLAGVLFVGAIAAIWALERKPPVIPKPVVAISSPPLEGVLAITHAPILSQVQEASSVALTPHSAVVITHVKPVISFTNSASAVAASGVLPRQTNVNARMATAGPASPANKELKKVSLQQQAENEFRKAYLLAQQGQLKEAVDGYQLALHLDPSHVMAREALVSVLQESKRNTEAEAVLKEVLTLDDKQTHYAMLLARLQVERNAVPLALETLERSLPYAERLADYQAFMAALLQRQGRHSDAIPFYQNALQLSPASGLWLMGLGISLQAELRKDEAMDIYKRSIETHSLSPELQAFVEQQMKEIKEVKPK